MSRPRPLGADMSYPPPYGAPSPYPRPQKDNTLVWVLVTIAVMIFLCCCGIVGVLGWTGWFASQEISSAVSSIEQGQPVEEGDRVSVAGGSVEPGWTITDTGDGLVPSDIEVTNESDSERVISFSVNFIADGVEIGDSQCTTPAVEPGDTRIARCMPTVDPIHPLDYDSLTISRY